MTFKSQNQQSLVLTACWVLDLHGYEFLRLVDFEVSRTPDCQPRRRATPVPSLQTAMALQGDDGSYVSDLQRRA